MVEKGWYTRGDTERRHHVSREPNEATEEHIDTAGHGLHIFADEDGAGWVVWLNCGPSEDFSGLVLGVGDTRRAAVAQAVLNVEDVLEALQGPSPEALKNLKELTTSLPDCTLPLGRPHDGKKGNDT